MPSSQPQTLDGRQTPASAAHSHRPVDPLRPARGIVYGLGFALIFWAVLSVVAVVILTP